MNSAESNESHFDDLLLACDQQLAGEAVAAVDLSQLDFQDRIRLERASDCLGLLQLLHDSRSGDPLREQNRIPPRFHVIRTLGSGGFGEVLLAEDSVTQSRVAVKIPHPGAIAEPLDRQRFLREARVLSTIQHPAIVKIIESGEYEGLPFLVMEYCDGGNLGQLITDRQHRPSPGEAARIIQQIADGLGLLHRQGILHRDIKPRNILLRRRNVIEDERIATPEESHSATSISTRMYEAVLTDFGLAKSLVGDSDSAKTRSGAIAGTPQYMAPEQVAGRSEQIGPATDVHGLGIVFYELLTGQQPYLGDSPTETCWNILHQEPIPVRTIRPKVPRDLETLCMRAIEKSPENRFANSKEFADELQRFLNHQPILTQPVRWWEKAWKWGVRRPSQALLLLVIFLSLSVMSVGGWWYSSQLSAALSRESNLVQSESTLRAAAEEKNQTLIRQQAQLDDSVQRESLLAYTAQIRLAYDLKQQGHELESAAILDQWAQSNHRDFVWRHLVHQSGGRLTQLTGLNQSSNFRSVSLIPEKNWIVAGTGHGSVAVLDAKSLRPLPSPFPSVEAEARVHGFAYHAPSTSWYYCFYPEDYESRSNGSQLLCLREPRGEVTSISSGMSLRNLSISPDRSRFAIQNQSPQGENRFDFYSMETGKPLWFVHAESAVDRLIGWAHDGRVAIPTDNQIRIYSSEGKLLESLNSPLESSQLVFTARFSTDDQTLAVLLSDMSVDLYRWTDGRFVYLKKIRCAVPGPVIFEDNRYGWHDLEFRDHDKQLVIDGPERRVFVVSIESGKELCRSSAFNDNLMTILELPDKSLLLHELDRELYRWAISPQKSSIAGHNREAWTVDFSPDGRTIVTGSDDGTAKLWSVSTGELLETLGPFDMTVVSSRFSPDGSRLATLLLDGRLHVWEFDTESQRVRGKPAVIDAHRRGRCLTWSSDSQRLASGGYDGEIFVYRADPLAIDQTHQSHEKTVRQLRFVNQDRELLSVSNDGRSVKLPLQAAANSDQPIREDSEIHSFVLLPDGETVALGLRSGVVSLRRFSGERVGLLVGHQERVRSLALSPSGKVLVSGDEAGLLRFWRVENQQLLMSVQHSQSSINELVFSPRGDVLAIATHDGKVALWHAPESDSFMTHE